jgi:hypothetical protein
VSGGGVVDEASNGDTRGSDREDEVWHLGSAEARPPQPFLVALVKSGKDSVQEESPGRFVGRLRLRTGWRREERVRSSITEKEKKEDEKRGVVVSERRKGNEGLNSEKRTRDGDGL